MSLYALTSPPFEANAPNKSMKGRQYERHRLGAGGGLRGDYTETREGRIAKKTYALRWASWGLCLYMA